MRFGIASTFGFFASSRSSVLIKSSSYPVSPKSINRSFFIESFLSSYNRLFLLGRLLISQRLLLPQGEVGVVFHPRIQFTRQEVFQLWVILNHVIGGLLLLPKPGKLCGAGGAG